MLHSNKTLYASDMGLARKLPQSFSYETDPYLLYVHDFRSAHRDAIGDTFALHPTSCMLSRIFVEIYTISYRLRSPKAWASYKLIFCELSTGN